LNRNDSRSKKTGDQPVFAPVIFLFFSCYAPVFSRGPIRPRAAGGIVRRGASSAGLPSSHDFKEQARQHTRSGLVYKPIWT
jgi:hypothetical protein